MPAQASKKSRSEAARELQKARSASLTPERRREIARKAAKARWAKRKKPK